MYFYRKKKKGTRHVEILDNNAQKKGTVNDNTAGHLFSFLSVIDVIRQIFRIFLLRTDNHVFTGYPRILYLFFVLNKKKFKDFSLLFPKFIIFVFGFKKI